MRLLGELRLRIDAVTSLRTRSYDLLAATTTAQFTLSQFPTISAREAASIRIGVTFVCIVGRSAREYPRRNPRDSALALIRHASLCEIRSNPDRRRLRTIRDSHSR